MLKRESTRKRREERVASVLISSGRPMFLEGMSLILGDDPHIQILGRSEDLSDAIHKVGLLHPEVVMLDISGITNERVLDAISYIRELNRKVKILVLNTTGTISTSDPYYAAGARHVILPGTSLMQLFCMIHDEDMLHRGHHTSAAA